MRNARFTSHPPYSTVVLLRDLREGLRYLQDGREKRLPWSTTFLELEAFPFAQKVPHDRFGWPVYRFNLPLHLGDLEIGGLQVNVPNKVHQPGWRMDVPLDNLPFEVRLAGDGADNYWQLKAYFQAALGDPLNGWERDDQLHAGWNYDGLGIGITYWLQSFVTKGESGFASLNITNERIFSKYFQDAYVDAFALERPGLAWQSFDGSGYTIPHFYRNSQWVRFTPGQVRTQLQETQRDLLVWHDPEQRKLGFAKDDLFCKVVDLAGDLRFVLQLIDHDRGQYSHELQAVWPDMRTETLLSGGVGALDEVVLMLERWAFEIEKRAE